MSKIKDQQHEMNEDSDPVVTAFSTRVSPTIDEEWLRSGLPIAEDGLVEPDPNLMDYNQVVEIFHTVLKSNGDGGDRGRTVKSSAMRIMSGSDRPLGSTPVRGSGLQLFGNSVYLESAETYTSKDLRYFKNRNTKIEEYALSCKQLYDELLANAETEGDRIVGEMEALHQSYTGGGYDNGQTGATYKTAWKFYTKQKELPQLDTFRRQAVVEACDQILEHLVASGATLGSLQPVPYPEVRASQDKDGTIGFPIYERGDLEFSPKNARAIKAVYGLDLYEYIGTMVPNLKDLDQHGQPKLTKFRNLDAVAMVINQVKYDRQSFAPLITLFQRIQRHGYEHLEEGNIQAKSGKIRAVFVPDAHVGGLGACIGQAIQDEIMRIAYVNMPSLMAPKPMRESVLKMVDWAKGNDYVCLSIDESQYDATLQNCIMATVMERIFKPLFREEYHALVDMCTAGLTHKVLVFPSYALDIIQSGGEASNISEEEIRSRLTDYVLVACTNGGLISGHKLTHIMGSFYGGVFQLVLHKILDYKPDVPIHVGSWRMAGDDCVFLIPKSMVDLDSAEGTYGLVSEEMAALGLEVNTAKQIHIVADDEPLTIFLQVIYHAGCDVRGEGSSARPLQSMPFAEYRTEHNSLEQVVQQLSILETGATSRWIDVAVEKWLSTDPKVCRLFQDLGVKAWDFLKEAIGMSGRQLAESGLIGGSFEYHVDREAIARGESLQIIDTVARVAAALNYQHEADYSDWQTTSTAADAQSDAIDSEEQDLYGDDAPMPFEA